MCQMLIQMEISERMEISIPLPDTHIMNHGGRHGFARCIEASGNKAGTHDPPCIIILSPVSILHLWRAGKPFMPALRCIVDDFLRIRNVAIETQARSDIEHQRFSSL